MDITAREPRSGHCLKYAPVVVFNAHRRNHRHFHPPQRVRNIRATLIGVGITISLVVMLEAIGSKIWPFMASVDMKNPAAIKAAVESAPAVAMLWVVASYAIAGFFGSFLACKMSGGVMARPSWIVGTVLFVACALNSYSIPQPLWMNIASVLVPFPSAWLGLRSARVST